MKESSNRKRWKMEHSVGFEPMTCWVQCLSSTTVPPWEFWSISSQVKFYIPYEFIELLEGLELITSRTRGFFSTSVTTSAQLKPPLSNFRFCSRFVEPEKFRRNCFWAENEWREKSSFIRETIPKMETDQKINSPIHFVSQKGTRLTRFSHDDV